MKKYINIAVYALSLLGVMVVLGFVESKRVNTSAAGLEVYVDNSDGNYFVEKDDIANVINDLGYNVNADQIKNIEFGRIEELLDNNPSIKKAHVYADFDGMINVKITQRKPLVRVYSMLGDSYYIDEEGWLMPLSGKYTSRVIIANGNVKAGFRGQYDTQLSPLFGANDTITTSAHRQLQDLYRLSTFINYNEFWRSQITQIFVTADGEYELVPRVGNHIIELGTIDEMEEKFAKLFIFYKKGLGTVGWNNYKTINLKYKNQVVCTKKSSYGS